MKRMVFLILLALLTFIYAEQPQKKLPYGTVLEKDGEYEIIGKYHKIRTKEKALVDTVIKYENIYNSKYNFFNKNDFIDFYSFYIDDMSIVYSLFNPTIHDFEKMRGDHFEFGKKTKEADSYNSKITVTKKDWEDFKSILNELEQNPEYNYENKKQFSDYLISIGKTEQEWRTEKKRMSNSNLFEYFNDGKRDQPGFGNYIPIKNGDIFNLSANGGMVIIDIQKTEGKYLYLVSAAGSGMFPFSKAACLISEKKLPILRVHGENYISAPLEIKCIGHTTYYDNMEEVSCLMFQLLYVGETEQ